MLQLKKTYILLIALVAMIGFSSSVNAQEVDPVANGTAKVGLDSNVTQIHFEINPGDLVAGAAWTSEVNASKTEQLMLQIFSGDVGDATSTYNGATGGMTWWIEGKPGTGTGAIASATIEWATLPVGDIPDGLSSNVISKSSSAVSNYGFYVVEEQFLKGMSLVRLVVKDATEGLQAVFGLFEDK